MPAGYSGTPTARKLGIKPGLKLVVVNAPDDYERLIDGLPKGFPYGTSLRGKADMVHAFVTREAELARRLPCLAIGRRT